MQLELNDYDGTGVIPFTISLDDNLLHLSYDASGLDDVDWPDPIDNERADDLWRQTCFELFIAEPGMDSYTELNLSPSGQWNCYSFSGYRQGMGVSRDLVPVSFHALAERRRLSVTLDCRIPGSRFLLGPAAVIRTSNGHLRYFACSHGEVPDFHDRSYYVQVSRNQL